MPTVINVYDTVASIGVNDPEASLTIYEMFIGVGPTGPTGATGPAGAAAVAGVLPSEYVEMVTPRTVTSATLVDITGVTANITLDSTVNIAVFMDCEVSSDGVCDLGLAISINGTDHDVTTTHLNGTTDEGKVTVIHRTATPLAAGTYTVKGRFLRSSGTASPQVDRADFLVFDSTVTITTDATSDMIFGVASAWAKKTLAEGKIILGITNSPNVATDATNDMMFGVANAWAKKTVAEGKTILEITNAPNVATTAANDFIIGSGAAWQKKTLAETKTVLGVDVLQSSVDGWIPATGTWSYASATTVTVPAGATAVYSDYCKLRWKQGGAYKYAYGKLSSDTVMVIYAGSVFTVADSAITDVYYSNAASPLGFTQEFTYVPSLTNLSGGVFTIATFSIVGKRCKVLIEYTLGGAGVAGSVDFSLPIPSMSGLGASTAVGVCHLEDSGTTLYAGDILLMSTTKISLRALNAAGTYLIPVVLSSTIPHTWANTDKIYVSFDYPIA